MRIERRALGAALRSLRKHGGFTQETLAFESGVDRSFISLIELGASSPSFDTLCDLCKALKVTVTCLAVKVDELLLDV